MKIVRFGAAGHERPGLLDSSDVIRDLSTVIADWSPQTLGRAELARIGALDVTRLPAVRGQQRLGVPLSGVGKFIAIGLNYADHAAEAKKPIPTEPVIFTKAISSLTGPSDEVMLPRGSTHGDWEVELGVVIGTTARYVERSRALDHVVGYCLVDDVSEREYQNDRGGTWDKGKGCDTFGPVGPWLVTPDELGDPQDLDLWLDVNGVRRQTGNTRTMIFPVAELVAYVSEFMTLEPGDILATGTPPGVGMGMKPEPVYLKVGDIMRLGSTRLGVQQHTVVPWRRL
jgi:2-keto-4-pentenoate hydratase/2-oxohepta-3-ene-1,7-dioic acid hydratase in catechol pathway